MDLGSAAGRPVLSLTKGRDDEPRALSAGVTNLWETTLARPSRLRSTSIMSDATFHLLQLLYFMAPAYLANMAPPFIRFWHGWNPPIHVRALGSHKTVLGFAVGVLTAVLCTAGQAWLAQPWLPTDFALVDYRDWLLLGLGFGVGALGGDALKSLFKRRLGFAPGQRWLPFDQLDFVVGSLLLVAPMARLNALDVLSILAVSFIGDLIVNRIAFAWRIKETPW